MDCKRCGVAFDSIYYQQVYCRSCATTCIDCGAKRDRSAVRCSACYAKRRIGVPNPSARRPHRDNQTITDFAETIGLETKRQYAFGFVIGVMFGDGSISKVIDHAKRRCTGGTITIHTTESFRPRLQTTNESFANNFTDAWFDLTGRRVKVWAAERRFGKATLPGMPDNLVITVFTVAPRHVLLGRYLARLKYDLGPTGLPSFPLETQRGIVDGLIASEGYKAANYIDVANKDRILLEAMVTMCRNLGMKAKIYDSPSQHVLHLRIT